jgi:hypothetical protein
VERQHGNRAEQAEQASATTDAAARDPAPDEALLQLQQSAGNRAVGRLLNQVQGVDPPPSEQKTGDAALPGPATLAALGRRGGGEPLPAPLLGRAERALGADLAGVRLHKGADASDAARELEANAFTEGQDVFFGGGKFEPETPRGHRLLMHELAHTLQSAPGGHPRNYTVSEPGEPAEAEAHAFASRALKGAAVAPQASAVPAGRIMRDHVRVPVVEPEPDEDDRRSDEGEVPVEDEDEAEGMLAPASASSPDFPLEVKKVDKAEGDMDEGELVFIVPADLDREAVARRLFDDPQKGRAFDFVPAGELKTGGGRPARAVRVRDLRALTADAASRLRDELERELQEDVNWIVAKLKERFIDESEELELLARSVKWSQRSDWKDSDGIQYFDRFLNALDLVWLTGRVFASNTKRTALTWLLVELENKKTYLYELIGHRSKTHKPVSVDTGEAVPAGATMTQWRPVTQLGPHHVVGYFKFKTRDVPVAKGQISFDYITIKEKLLVETTRERAEIAARNAATRLPRVILPGDDDHFHVFSLNFPYFDEAQKAKYEEKDGERFYDFWWVYPVTAFVRGGEYQAESAKGTGRDKEQGRDILDEALSKATADDPSPLIGLDFDVLALATLDERVTILKLIVNGKRASETASFDLLTRLLYTTPAKEFPLLERRMSTEGITARMLRLNVGTNLLATFGRIFTKKTLASQPVTAQSLADMVTLKLGEDADGWYHYATGDGPTVASKVVARKDWKQTDAPRVGNEPGVPGEEGGALDRTAVVFYSSKLKLSLDKPEVVKSRELLPTELVRIEVLGTQPQTLIVTALEAAGLLDVKSEHLVKYIVSPLAKVYAIAFTGAGLVRVFGAALAEGLMAGGLEGAAVAVGQTAATRAGASALWNAFLLASMEGVEHFRGELEKNEAGRAFLATYDIASSILIARDVFHLMSSGVVRPLAKLASAAGGVVGEAGRAGLLRLEHELEAMLLAWKRMGDAGELAAVEASTGWRISVPKNPLKFPQYLMAARADTATTRLVTTLGTAGRETKVVRELFETIQKEVTALLESDRSGDGARGEELAKAQRAIANHAATLEPAVAEALLTRMKAVLDLRPRQAGALAAYLQAATRVPDPMGFLDEVTKLVSRKGLTRKTVEVFSEKALLHTYSPEKGVDVAWLNTLKHSDADLNALGSDPNTSWLPIQTAVKEITAAVPKYNRLPWVRSILRGAAAEMVTAAELRKNLVPGARIKGEQVQMLDSKIDFALEFVDDVGKARTHGLEVKGYTGETFRDALNTFINSEHIPFDKLDKETQGVRSKIDRMLKQLKDAKSFTGNHPYLAVTDDLTGPTKRKLEEVVNKYAPGTEIVYLPESEIKGVSQRLAEGFGIPEVERLKAQLGKAAQIPIE